MVLALSSLHAPTKLVLQSEQSWMIGPLIARNLQSTAVH